MIGRQRVCQRGRAAPTPNTWAGAVESAKREEPPRAARRGSVGVGARGQRRTRAVLSRRRGSSRSAPRPGPAPRAGRRAEPSHAELLDGEGGEDAAVDDGAPEIGVGHPSHPRQGAHETPGEGVARAGGIDHALERDRGTREVLAGSRERAVLPHLDHHRFGPQLEDGARRLVRERFAGQLARLLLVDEEDPHAFRVSSSSRRLFAIQ